VPLEPLSTDHDDGLWEASRPPEVWTWVSEQPATRDSFGRYLDAARAATAARTEFAFATVSQIGIAYPDSPLSKSAGTVPAV